MIRIFIAVSLSVAVATDLAVSLSVAVATNLAAILL
jgi:hypothetical protein